MEIYLEGKILILLVTLWAIVVFFKKYYLGVVHGLSMFPTFNPNDIIIIKRVSICDLREDDVIVCKTPNKNTLMMKRIKSIWNYSHCPTMYLLGDNPNSSYDSRSFGKLPLGYTKGLVVMRIKTGYLLKWLGGK